jgi:hypothetical protein
MVLRRLFERHPELRAEADALVTGLVIDVDAGDIANAIRDAVLALDLDDLGGRAGRHSGGYTEPTEAARELLKGATEPFLDDLKRHIELGFEAAAVATCKGIVRGLSESAGMRSVLDENSDQVLGWAPDFPGEAGGDAIVTLTVESAKQHGRRWTLPEDCVDAVADWAAMVEKSRR